MERDGINRAKALYEGRGGEKCGGREMKEGEMEVRGREDKTGNRGGGDGKNVRG